MTGNTSTLNVLDNNQPAASVSPTPKTSSQVTNEYAAAAKAHHDAVAAREAAAKAVADPQKIAELNAQISKANQDIKTVSANAKAAAAANMAPTSVKQPDSDQKNGLATLSEKIFANELIYNYTEPTYHLTWSMAPEELSYYADGGGKSDPIEDEDADKFIKKHNAKFKTDAFLANRIIIAESAVTADLNIQTLTLESVISPSGGARKTIPTSFTMELFEPFGCTLFDIMSKASIILGINDWKIGTHHTLEIEFFGRDKQTGAYDSCKFPRGQKNKWIWRFAITDITAKVDEGGAHYTLKGCPIGDLGQNKQVFQTPVKITKKGGGTVGAFFKKLEKDLNKWYAEQRGKQVPIPRHTFGFHFEPTIVSKNAIDQMKFIDKKDFKDWDIVSSIKSAKRNVPMDKGTKNNNDWPEGTSFEQILQDVQCATQQMQQVITGKKDAGSDPIKDRKNILKVDFRIVSDIIVKKYDSFIRQYEYHFFHRIVPIITSTPIPDELKPKDRNLKKADTNAHQQERYGMLGKNKVVCKKYSHIYTGENQDLLDFQIDLNLMCFSQLPKLTSSYGTTDSGIISSTSILNKRLKEQADAKATNVSADKQQEAAMKKADADFASPDVKKAIVANSNKVLAKIPQDGANKSVSSTVDTMIQGLLKIKDSQSRNTLDALQDTNRTLSDHQRLKLVSDGMLAAANSDKSGLSKEQREALKKAAAQINTEADKQYRDTVKNNASQLRQAVFKDKKNYAIELKYENTEIGKLLKEQLQRLQDYDLLQITTVADTETLSAAAEQNDSKDDMQKLTMAMLNQTHNSSQLITVKIGIVGDPYWLGMDNVDGIEALNKETDALQMNQYGAATAFLLELKFPENYNEETGMMEFSAENLFKGLYVVNKATHKFADGKFTQELEAVREMLTNMLTQSVDPSEPVPNQKPAEGAGKDNAKSTNPAPIAPKKPPPTTAEKDARRKKYIEYFMSQKGPNGQNWTEDQAKGIVANLEAESGLDPTIHQKGGGGGEGLAQWTSRGQKDDLAKFAGYPPGTDVGSIPEEKQLEYLNHQLNSTGPYGEKNAGKALQQQTTLDGSISTVTTKFERPANKDMRANERVAMLSGRYSNTKV